jgi:hypothetical protein
MATKTTTKKELKFDFKTMNTVEAAFKKCGLDPATLPDVSKLPERFSFLTTCFILSVIFEAINDGWEPDFSNHNQYKYFPWPWISSSGFGFSSAIYGCAGTNSAVGSRLCTDTSEKAIWILEQFPELWRHWLLNVKPE